MSNSLFLKRYKTIADALNGSGGFLDGSYLTRYSKRESDEDYTERKNLAQYRNFLRSACNSYVGYIAKKPPMRVVNNPLLAMIVDAANAKNDSLDIFWHQFMIELKARSVMLLLVDMPQQLPESQDEQIINRKIPYLTPIYPEQIFQYTLNDSGMLESIEIQVVEQSLYGSELYICGWDAQRWWKRGYTDGVEIASGEHGLGICPVLIASETGQFPGFGEFEQITGLSLQYYNVDSELTELRRKQSFSIFTVQVPSTMTALDIKEVMQEVGTKNGVPYFGERPAYVSPGDGPTAHHETRLDKIVSAIKEVEMNIEDAPNASGIAQTIRFQRLNGSLTAFARIMEDLERRMWDLAAKWLGLENVDIAVSWSKDYSISDINQELIELQQMQSINFPDEVITAKKKVVAQLALSNLQPDELEEILQSIESAEVMPDTTTDLEF
ncbi:44 kda structural protein [Caudoviricetes sp.]|nr:44 kda structural protein [Caudoviricetes sp.]